MGHAIGDLNNDGYLEWFSTAIFDNATNCEVTGCMFGNKGNKLYKNLGDRKFQEIADQVRYWLELMICHYSYKKCHQHSCKCQ